MPSDDATLDSITADEHERVKSGLMKRIGELSAKLREAEGRLATMDESAQSVAEKLAERDHILERLQAKHAEDLAEREKAIEAARGEITTAKRDAAYYRHGVDNDELRAYIDWSYERASATAGDEKPDFGEWLGSYVQGDNVVLQALRGRAVANGSEAQDAAAQPAPARQPAPPPTNARGAAPLGAKSELGYAEIAAAKDWAAVREQLGLTAKPK